MRNLRFIAFELSALGVVIALLLTGCDDPLAARTSPDEAATELIKDEAALKRRIDEVRALTQRRYMNTRDHAAWQIVHGILAYQHKLEIDHEGQRVPALRWLLDGGELRGFTLVDRGNGLLDSVLESGSKTGQGHDDQWLGYLDACDMRADDEITWQGQKFKLRGMVQQAMRDLRELTPTGEPKEFSWTLMALSGFAERDPGLVPFDKSWEVRYTERDKKEVVEQWSLERIIGHEARQNLPGSACGGTHRLVGMTLALNRYRNWYRKTHGHEPTLREGRNKDDQPTGWALAHDTIRMAIETFRETQQPDGAFSAAYLSRPSTTVDAENRMRTTGHAFEFLSWALTEQEFKQDWMARAAVHLCELFDKTQAMPIDCGALYHAARGLQVYRERRWGKE